MSEQIHPWDTLARCGDFQQTSKNIVARLFITLAECPLLFSVHTAHLWSLHSLAVEHNCQTITYSSAPHSPPPLSLPPSSLLMAIRSSKSRTEDILSLSLSLSLFSLYASAYDRDPIVISISDKRCVFYHQAARPTSAVSVQSCTPPYNSGVLNQNMTLRVVWTKFRDWQHDLLCEDDTESESGSIYHSIGWIATGLYEQ